jgi:hypothetical protein
MMAIKYNNIKYLWFIPSPIYKSFHVKGCGNADFSCYASQVSIMEETMRNIMTAGIGLAALVASGVVMANEPTTMGELITSADELGVTADGRLVADDISISQMVADAASGSGDGDGDGDGDAAGDSGDSGKDGGCGCATTTANGLGALALLLPMGLVATRRRS